MRLILTPLAAFAALGITAPAFSQAPGEPSAVIDPACQRDCLLGHLRAHMEALRAKDVSRLPLAADAVITENNVILAPGTGLWRTVTAVDEVGLETADPRTGNAAWFGSVRENGEPAIMAVRIHVNEAGEIDEIESVVHRRTALPAPFGDVENMVHDPEFYEILPPAERRSRERLLAAADTYFDTVERNDGQVFAHFTEDCARLENGISTTAPPPGGGGGNAAAIASGCREQFELGIYYINKRIRRDHFIVDGERGVVVSRGFFDHDNEVDRYNLTNGREMRTALKWPNSITLIEAFRIKGGAIQRIEAVFTYVPYFMNNPFWGPDARPPRLAHDPAACDAACLDTMARGTVAAMANNQWRSVEWADKVGYAENCVGMRIGEGIWATVTAVDNDPLVVSDTGTGKAVWIGRIEEHGQPAWAAFTVSAAGDKVGAIDAVIRRKEYGPPWVEPENGAAPDFAVLPPARRTGRENMRRGAEAWYSAINERTSAPEVLGATCRLVLNGQDLVGCRDAFISIPPIEQIRDRQVLAVDEERGLIVYRTFEDFPAVGSGYPRTDQLIEIFRLEDGEVTDVYAWTSELPYGMRPHGAD